MSRRRSQPPIVSGILFFAVVLRGMDATLASVTDKLLLETTTDHYEVIGDEAALTVQEINSTRSEANAETTTDLLSIVSTADSTLTDSEGRHSEEPQLPVDLLSEDILLDPNVVLARVARDLDARESRSDRRWYRRPLRRTNERSDYYRQPIRDRNYETHRRPIYPVFPGRK